MIQWLRLCAFTVRGMDSIPGWRSRILHAARIGKKKKKSPFFLLTENKSWNQWLKATRAKDVNSEYVLFLGNFFFFFFPILAACRILLLHPGIESMPLTVEALSPITELSWNFPHSFQVSLNEYFFLQRYHTILLRFLFPSLFLTDVAQEKLKKFQCVSP